MNRPNRLRVGDRVVLQDDTPPHVLRALRRIEAAERRGDPPGTGTTAQDARTLLAWLDEQERKYGGLA